MNKGFLRVASAVPAVNVADCGYNVSEIIKTSQELSEKNVQIVVFPEMSISGYTCGDLFHTSLLIEKTAESLSEIAKASTQWNMLLFVGASVKFNGQLYNCAVSISRGRILGVVPKSYLLEHNGLHEKRWWQSGREVSGVVDIAGQSAPFGVNHIFDYNGVKVGVEIGEDLWAPIPPSTHAALAGAQVIVNLSAANEVIGKYNYLKSLIAQQSARSLSAYLYSGSGYGESSTDFAFSGNAIIAESGAIVAESQRWDIDAKSVIADVDVEAINRERLHNSTFAESKHSSYDIIPVEGILQEQYIDVDKPLYKTINPLPFVPQVDIDNRCEEVVNIQVAGLARRLEFTHCKSLVVGISGGLDSTLALLVAVRTFDRLGLDRTGILGITMPGFGTTDRTYNNALKLMSALGITQREISIVPSVEQHFIDINHDKTIHDVTYENSQARERTQILMDVANQVCGMVLGTGDLSELALGWATYNGDHMSMYGVNAGVPKTLVKYLVKWIAQNSESKVQAILDDVVNTPISPELIPADEDGNIKQKTEDLVGPYELHDFFIYYAMRYGYSPKKIFFLAQKAFGDIYSHDVIKHWITTFFRRFFNQQFKRSCLPDGPKVGSVGLSPRGDWNMPSDASSALWLKECDQL